MTNRFAIELRKGYEQVAASLPTEALERVARARDSINAELAERNRLLAEVVTAYRAGLPHLWGPVILDLLAPSLVELLAWLRPEPPTIDEEEIRQQLVVEVLRAAARIPIRDGFDMKVRLLARAYKYVVRWLAREGVRQGAQCSYEALRELER
jgi:hypothetical protein